MGFQKKTDLDLSLDNHLHLDQLTPRRVPHSHVDKVDRVTYIQFTYLSAVRQYIPLLLYLDYILFYSILLHILCIVYMIGLITKKQLHNNYTAFGSQSFGASHVRVFVRTSIIRF